MTELASEFRAWVLAQATDFDVDCPDDEHVLIGAPDASACVTFYELDPGAPEIAELSAAPVDDPDNPTFFLHFEMDDLAHAQQLFGELLESLRRAGSRDVTRILLSCTSGLTTTFFAKRLAEVAATLSLDYEFEARPITEALEVAGDYAAVMLAPQVHMSRDEMVGRHPDLVVFEIPAAVFGAYDAGTALRMLLGALSEHALSVRLEKADTRIVRETNQDRRVLVITSVYGLTTSCIRYRLYDHGEILLDECVEHNSRCYRDIEEVVATLRLQGFSPEDLDAIGIAVPGIVNDQGVKLPSIAKDPYDLKGTLEARYGVPVFVDNNANAAAVGCYVSQREHESVLLHRQPIDYTLCGQGLIINGHLVRGAHGIAGEIPYMVRYIWGNDATHDRAWTSEQTAGLAASYVLTAMAATDPEAVYTAIDLVPDAETLTSELAKVLPEEYLPTVVPISDYHERVIVGEYALCLNALRQAEA